MRKRRQFLAFASTAASVVLAVVPTGASGTSGDDPSLTLRPRAGAIYQFDGSATGTGPSYPATRVTARMSDCPAGTSVLQAELVQDGVEMNWATSARGAGEVVCTGGENGTVSMGFYGPTLHPGTAVATFALVQGDVLVTVTRTVRIPG